ncbi:MAG TPA: aminotransferase class IV [Miltoncostaeaceae bacterium]|nr:aminotransferase class IV [Miltoncostaeaceae bacterium]
MSITLLETMRAGTGRVPWLERHLDRLLASAQAWELHTVPPRPELAERVLAAVARRAGDARVGLLAPTDGGCRVEVSAQAPLSAVPPPVRAVSLRGAWQPDERAWEHKIATQTEQRVRLRARFAERADRVVLLDDANRLGEADLANAFAVIDGRPVTAPARGLLPGVTRAAVIDRFGAREEILDERAWRAADELFLTSAVTGVVSVVEVDGYPIGRGRIGPVARAVQRFLIEEWSSP